MQLHNLDQQTKIPMLRTPVFRELEIAGHTVRVFKPKARQACIIATRISESYGERILDFFVTPSEELARLQVLTEGEAGNAAWMKAIVASGFLKEAMKRMKLAGQELGPDHLYWYLEQAIPGNVQLGEHVFASVDELDDAQFSFIEQLQILQVTVELCIYPTSDDPDTGDGESGAKSEGTAQAHPASQRTLPQGERRPVATSKAGQSAPILRPPG